MSAPTHNRFVFIHIAKTAGTSLAQLLRDTVPDDQLSIRVHRPFSTLPPDPDQLAFSVIRDPVDRLISAFFWLHLNPTTLWDGDVANHDLVRELGLSRYTDCRDFLDNFDTFYADQIQPYAENLATCDQQLDTNMTYCHFNLFVPQHLYLTDAQGQLQVTRLLRWNHLPADVAGFLAEVAPGTSLVPLPHLYASRRGPATDFVSERSMAIVREIYAGDLALPGMTSSAECPAARTPTGATPRWTAKAEPKVLIGPIKTPLDLSQLASFAASCDVTTFGPWKHADVCVDDIITLDDITAVFEDDWTPDLMALWHPESAGLPLGLERAPFPVVMLSDPQCVDLSSGLRSAAACDFAVTNTRGAAVFQAAGCNNAVSLPLPELPHLRPRVTVKSPRDIDVVVNGGLNPDREADWCELLQLPASVMIRQAAGLERARISVFRPLRGEIGPETLAAAAAGTCLFLAGDDLRLPDRLVPDLAVVVYDRANLRSRIEHYLAHDAEREAVAAAGQTALAAPTPRANLRAIIDHVEYNSQWLETRSRRRQKPCPAPTPIARALGRLHTAIQFGLPATENIAAIEEIVDLLHDQTAAPADPWQTYLLPPEFHDRFQWHAWSDPTWLESTARDFLLAFAYEKRAEYELEHGDPEKACTSLRSAVDVHPQGVFARPRLANLLASLGDISRAVAVAEEHLRLRPTDTFLTVQLAEWRLELPDMPARLEILHRLRRLADIFQDQKLYAQLPELGRRLATPPPGGHHGQG